MRTACTCTQHRDAHAPAPDRGEWCQTRHRHGAIRDTDVGHGLDIQPGAAGAGVHGATAIPGPAFTPAGHSPHVEGGRARLLLGVRSSAFAHRLERREVTLLLRSPQLAQRARGELADAVGWSIEDQRNLVERSAVTALEAEAQAEDLALQRVERLCTGRAWMRASPIKSERTGRGGGGRGRRADGAASAAPPRASGGSVRAAAPTRAPSPADPGRCQV